MSISNHPGAIGRVALKKEYVRAPIPMMQRVVTPLFMALLVATAGLAVARQLLPQLPLMLHPALGGGLVLVGIVQLFVVRKVVGRILQTTLAKGVLLGTLAGVGALIFLSL
ncbi:hypothetical protein [Magnetococcus sp. PR-3]|uniref:hypothetical protein n=1 Tax=Magnetococcus sp. PR-3 TaxID=3120355 RepID=UPI002FCE3E1C